MARKYWYGFTGASGTENQINKYVLIPGPENCTEGPDVCAIYAIYGGDTHPISLSSHILTYIAQAKIDMVCIPRTGPKIVCMIER